MKKRSMRTPREHDACGIGAVVNIDGRKEHRTLTDALSIVEKLEHRAGKDAAGEVGDGVGVLLQVSFDFFHKVAAEEGIALDGERDFAVGMFFLPEEMMRRTLAMRLFGVICEKNGLPFLGWRKVPVKPEILGAGARKCMPDIRQCFVARPEGCGQGLDFERKLYVCRREFEQSAEDTYICSLSSRTVVYKGMFLVGQLRGFYPDLSDPDMKTAVAMVHSRFSTNTTPAWERAHPYRLIAHNGEINTIRGNADRMSGREETMKTEVFEDARDKVFPVIPDAASDSAMFDNTLEFCMMSGMDLPLAVMTMIPEPWKHNHFLKEQRRNFYHYYATMMEPWDGPAAILFSDGDTFGATLDRNGLRPARYYVTDDSRLILSSEVGVLDLDPSHIVKKSRLMPGKILLVDTSAGRMISDDECKDYYAARHPYGEWLSLNLVRLSELPIPNHKIPVFSREMRMRMCRAFGYTWEDVKQTVIPMAENGVEPTASMGHDVPLAVLSEKHQPLFNYFKQLFAQVTNPPIDSLREKVVTDTTVYIGSDGNLLEASGSNCRVLEIDHPILTGVDLMKIRALDRKGLRAKTVPILYYKYTSLEKALSQLNVAVDKACLEGFNILILSDRGVDENHVPIPSLLAVSSVEQHLIETRRRTSVSLIVETGDARDVHQMACLLGFGARAVNPYLAHECISGLIEDGYLDKDYHTAIDDYNSAVLNGIVKIAAKMGISTIQSYQSSRIFEAVGISREVIDRYFAGITSRAGGIGLPEIAETVSYLHDHAFDPMGLSVGTDYESTGFHSLRSGEGKEDHLYSPKTIIALQRAVRAGDYTLFREYTKLVDSSTPHTLRGLLEFVPQKESIPLEETEPASEIVKRFKTGAMSFGSLSKEAHETLAEAMNSIGGKSNTGEGGEDPARFGTSRNSAIKQVASGRFGVTGRYLLSASEIQIKMAQGAKPGEGGHLPGRKVYPQVAATRFSTPGISLISPPPHHDIYSIEDLAQLIYDLKCANRAARINVKLVSEDGVGTIACGVAKAGASVILISGYDGGTGAAPVSSIHHAGLPWELGLSEAHHALIDSGLRERVVLETDGKLMSGRDVAIAALLGAEEFAFATAPLVSMGCMMMRACSRDSCPVGIATQNEELRKRFRGRKEDVVNFMMFIAEEVREIMAYLGFRSVNEMVGRSDCLKMKNRQITRRAETVDLECVIESSRAADPGRIHDPRKNYDFGLEKTLDEAVLLREFRDHLENGSHHEVCVPISSMNRTAGTILGSEITARYPEGLPEDTFVVRCTGGAGQSFGAFIPKGLTLKVTGDANDGFGKGLSGGKLIAVPPADAAFRARDNTIIGNVALYGAISGKAYIDGIAGERFLVRNSGALAVSLGCGDHGLEYMTGGRAVILGMTGKNLAAGMSGGLAYVLDEDHTLYLRVNRDMAVIREIESREEEAELLGIIEDFVKETSSETGREILEKFDYYRPKFKVIVPEPS